MSSPRDDPSGSRRAARDDVASRARDLVPDRQALAHFGAPVGGLEFCRKDIETPGMVVQPDLPPRRIDLLTEASGLHLEEAWENRMNRQGRGTRRVGRSASRRWAMRGKGRLGVGTVLVLAAAFLVSALGVAAGDDEKDAGSDDEKYVEFTKEHPLGQPEAGKALIYVLRPTSMGAAVKSFFIVDDTPAGINRGSSYFFIQVDPGKRLFWSKSENVDALELVVEAGKTYYIQQHVQMGGFRARTKLEVLAEAEGQAALAKCKKHGTMTARGRAEGAEIVVEYKKDTQEDLDRRAEEAAEKGDG